MRSGGRSGRRCELDSSGRTAAGRLAFLWNAISDVVHRPQKWFLAGFGGTLARRRKHSIRSRPSPKTRRKAGSPLRSTQDSRDHGVDRNAAERGSESDPR
jgi:hypothetical protein